MVPEGLHVVEHKAEQSVHSLSEACLRGPDTKCAKVFCAPPLRQHQRAKNIDVALAPCVGDEADRAEEVADVLEGVALLKGRFVEILVGLMPMPEALDERLVQAVHNRRFHLCTLPDTHQKNNTPE